MRWNPYTFLPCNCIQSESFRMTEPLEVDRSVVSWPSQSCAAVTTVYLRAFLSPPGEALYPVAVISWFPPTPPQRPALHSHQRTLCLCGFVCSGPFLWMAAVTEHPASKVPSHHSRCPCRVPFHGRVIFHGVSLPHFIDLLVVVHLWGKFLEVDCWTKWWYSEKWKLGLCLNNMVQTSPFWYFLSCYWMVTLVAPKDQIYCRLCLSLTPPPRKVKIKERVFVMWKWKSRALSAREGVESGPTLCLRSTPVRRLKWMRISLFIIRL